MNRGILAWVIGKEGQPSDARTRARLGVFGGIVGIACNLLLFAAKLIIGFWSGSISIAADAVNNLSDGLSCVISIVGFRLAAKKPDAQHPFGYGRTEYIAGLIVAMLIEIVGFEFLKTSFDRIVHPAPISFSPVLLVVLLLTMAVKLWMGWFNMRLGKCIHSTVLMAAAQDSRGDVITTGVVVLGMLAGRFTSLPVDGYVGILVALFILWSGLGIAKDTIAPLLGEAVDPEMAKNIEQIVLENRCILGIHDLIVHNYGAGRWIASLHAEVAADSDFVAVHEIIDEAEKHVWQRTGVFLVIHMDPVETNDGEVRILRERVDALLHELDDALSMHDFRVVKGEQHINLIFDVVCPFSYTEQKKQALKDTLRDKVGELDSRYIPVVTLEHSMG